jgi:UDP-3-O-[3-hydroxymyristoyl] glucosamine N-acyltransferase
MSRTASELAEYLRAELDGGASLVLAGVASPERAGESDLIYLDSPRHADRAMASRAVCVIAAPGTALPGKTVLRVAQPKLAFAKAAAWLLPEPVVARGIHPTAVVSPGARIAAGVGVGPYAVIEDGTEIGASTEIGAHCFIGLRAQVGENCRLCPRVTLYAGVRLGHRVTVHSGAVLGSDGFGYVFGEGRHWKFPQVGALEIGDDVEIGANTTIDRGSLDVTRIGAGVKLDNLVQVGHNVQIGDHSVLAAQVGISGSCTFGKNVVIGGQAGFGDHCRLEDGVVAGGQSGILDGKTVHAGQVVWGTPARPLERIKEQLCWLARLPQLAERLKRLERENAKE